MSEVHARLYAPAGPTFGPCAVCLRFKADKDDGLCRACRYLKTANPQLKATEQVGLAIKLLRRSDKVVRWPWAGLHEVGGLLPLKSVSFIAAGSGLGKTTFALDLVRRWVEQGVGVTVMTTETSPDEWRMSLAAISAGVPHGQLYDIFDEADRGNVDALQTLGHLERVVAVQATDDAWVERLAIVDDPEITMGAVHKAFALAQMRRHEVVLIDHIDHLGAERDEVSGRVSQGVEAAKQVNDALLELAKHYNVAVVAMSQLNANMTAHDRGNPLLRYAPPQLHDMLYSTMKVMIATQIFGLYRPLKPGLTPHDFRLAREGSIEPQEVLAPQRVGLRALKLRKRGHREGESVELAYVLGTLRDLTDDEKAQDVVRRSMQQPLSHRSPAFPTKGG